MKKFIALCIIFGGCRCDARSNCEANGGRFEPFKGSIECRERGGMDGPCEPPLGTCIYGEAEKQ